VKEGRRIVGWLGMGNVIRCDAVGVWGFWMDQKGCMVVDE
jgi:hypothetical protein